MSPTERKQALLATWRRDFATYARACLRVMNKDDVIVPLILNPMQTALLSAMQAQLAETGTIRILLLKARQMGASTLAAAFFFWLMHLEQKGRRAYLLAHEDAAAMKLTQMYHTYWEQHPQTFRRPRSRASAHQLGFRHGGGLEAATASTPAGGRGGTVSLYHGSEVAYWRHYAAHSAGSMQQVSKRPGSAIMLESTANGPVGGFYERWRNAELGRGRYLGKFFAWTWDPQYVLPVPRGFSLSREAPNELVMSEYDYQREHGCTMEQMAWRRDMIQELSDDAVDGSLVFTREYPITAREAFLQTSGKSLLSPVQVEAARLRSTELHGADWQVPLILGLDPATGHGPADSALCFRRGMKAYRLDRKHGLDATQLADYVYQAFCDEEADQLNIEAAEGTGQAVYQDLMRRPQTAGKCRRIMPGGGASDRAKWYNKRAEMWWRGATWIADGGAIIDESGIDGRTLASELLTVETKSGNERVIQVEAKDEIIKRLGYSPDGADAFMLTFAAPEPARRSARAHVARIPRRGSIPSSFERGRV